MGRDVLWVVDRRLLSGLCDDAMRPESESKGCRPGSNGPLRWSSKGRCDSVCTALVASVVLCGCVSCSRLRASSVA